MDKMHKSLCVCAGGRVRSVAARFILTDEYGHDALACGIQKQSGLTMSILFDWAETIWVLEQSIYDLIRRNYSEDVIAKLKLIDVGLDVWGYESNPTLRRLVYDLIERELGKK